MPLALLEDDRRRIGYADRAATYDLEYDEDSDAAFLSTLVTPETRSVLEIPCGAGNNTVRLARPGLRLVAVDLEPAMIARVRERIDGSARFADVVPVVGDMTDLQLAECFDLIVVQREAFQLIPRDRAAAALSRLRRHLAPGGILMIDLASFAPCPAEELHLQPHYFDPRAPQGRVIEEWTKTFPTDEVITRSRLQHRSRESVQITYDYHVRRPGGDEELRRVDLELTLYSRAAFTELVQAAGLRAIHCYRDYERSAYRDGSARMISLLTHAPETENLVGWMKEAATDFRNERDFRTFSSLASERLRPERLSYFGTYFDLYFQAAFIPGQGTEHILEALSTWNRGGRWLDLGAGTTTLFWSIALSEVTEITAADVVVEALAVLDQFARSSELPPCYRDVLRMLGRSVEHLNAMRERLRRFVTLDSLSAWPSALARERFHQITAIGHFAMAASAAHYAECVRHASAHLLPGGRLLGADWLRRPEFIASDGHDNSYLDERVIAEAAAKSSLKLVHCARADIAGDPHYRELLIWVMEQ